MGHVMEQPNPGDCLLEKILSRDNLIAAWKRVKANGGAPGIDGLTIEDFRPPPVATGMRSLNLLWQAPTNPRRSAAWRFQNRREVSVRLEFPVFWTV